MDATESKPRRFKLPSREVARKLSIHIGKLVIFYLCFYSILALFWAGYMWIYMASQTYHNLDGQLDENIADIVPGTTFRPIGKHASKLVINTRSIDAHFDQLVDTLAPYHVPFNRDDNPHMENCTGDAYASEMDNFCYFDITHLPAECSSDHKFGLSTGSPCVMLRLNRVYAWRPSPYQSDDLKSSQLALIVREDFDRRQGGSRLIYLTCDGETSDDVKHLGGVANVTYHPHQGIEYRHYAYRDQPGYLVPFVFVRFDQPTQGVNIHVRCSWWAKNIRQDASIAQGAIDLVLRIN